MSRRRRLVFLVLAVVSAVAGCASGESSRRPERAEGPTIGHDFKSMPRGRTIPATGLGVDLVDLRSRETLETASARVDAAVAPTASIGPGKTP